MSVTTTHPVAVQLNQIEVELNASFLERKEAIKATLLGLMAGEHIFILGLPGTGKTRLARAVVSTLTGATYFEGACSKNRPAEAFLGPVDIKELRESGNYVLKRKGFATDVDIAFIDEVGKMSPTLGHDMLALLNERMRHEVSEGLSVHKTPLHFAFTASNEVPTNESDDAAALWDRLLIRVVVDYLQEPANFAKLLTQPVVDPTTTVNYADLKEAADTVVPAVVLSDAVVMLIAGLRTKLGQQGIFPSDRRWRASVKILQAAAFLDGRTEVIPTDLENLRFALWDTLDQIEVVTRLCYEASNPYVTDLAVIHEGLLEIRKGILARDGKPENERSAYAREVNAKLVKVRADLDHLLTMAQVPGFKQSADLHLALTEEIAVDFLALPPDVLSVYLDKRKGLGNGVAA